MGIPEVPEPQYQCPIGIHWLVGRLNPLKALIHVSFLFNHSPFSCFLLILIHFTQTKKPAQEQHYPQHFDGPYVTKQLTAFGQELIASITGSMFDTTQTPQGPGFIIFKEKESSFVLNSTSKTLVFIRIQPIVTTKTIIFTHEIRNVTAYILFQKSHHVGSKYQNRKRA